MAHLKISNAEKDRSVWINTEQRAKSRTCLSFLLFAFVRQFTRFGIGIGIGVAFRSRTGIIDTTQQAGALIWRRTDTNTHHQSIHRASANKQTKE